MKISVISALFLATCVAYAAAQYPYNKKQTDLVASPDSEQHVSSTADTLSTYIVDFLTRKIQFFFELFDVKVRTIRFLTSLYTTDNLILLKKVMNIGLRFGNWLYTVIPDSTTEGHSALLSLLFPQSSQGDNFQDFYDETSADFSQDEPFVYSTTSSTTEAPSTGFSDRFDRFDRAEKGNEDEYNVNSLSDHIQNLNKLINSRRYYYNN